MKNIKKFNEFLFESINDKGIFHCVILAGGPGSGKSFVSKKMFSGSPFKVVNSDIFFEFLLQKENLPFVMHPEIPEIYDKQMSKRQKAKMMNNSKIHQYVNSLLPIVIDGTGAKLKKIEMIKNNLEKIGYDTYMVFVNTSLEVALERNSKRKRIVAPDIVKNLWYRVQQNIGQFQSMFQQNNFFLVDNTEILEGKELKKFELMLTRKMMKILSNPLKNQNGRKIIDYLKETGGKYLVDYLGSDEIKKIEV